MYLHVPGVIKVNSFVLIVRAVSVLIQSESLCLFSFCILFQYSIHLICIFFSYMMKTTENFSWILYILMLYTHISMTTQEQDCLLLEVHYQQDCGGIILDFGTECCLLPGLNHWITFLEKHPAFKVAKDKICIA